MKIISTIHFAEKKGGPLLSRWYMFKDILFKFAALSILYILYLANRYNNLGHCLELHAGRLLPQTTLGTPAPQDRARYATSSVHAQVPPLTSSNVM